MKNLQQRIQATLGFTNILINKQWRLYWLDRLLGFPVHPWEIDVMTVDGSRTAIISVQYDSASGFKVTLTGNISQDVFNNDEELTFLLCDLRDKLRAIFDANHLAKREAA